MNVEEGHFQKKVERGKQRKVVILRQVQPDQIMLLCEKSKYTMFLFWCGFEIMHHELGNTQTLGFLDLNCPVSPMFLPAETTLHPIDSLSSMDKAEIFQFIPDGRVGSLSLILKEWLTDRRRDWRTDSRRHIFFLYKKDDLIAKSYLLAIWQKSVLFKFR